MKIRKNKSAVSEVIGVAILLGISIALFSIVQVIVMSYPFEPAAPSVQLVGSIQDDTIYIEHHRGEAISFSAQIIIRIGNSGPITFDAEDYKNELHIDLIYSDNDELWEIGEILSYNLSETNEPIIVIVVDSQTNSIIMNAKVQEGT